MWHFHRYTEILATDLKEGQHCDYGDGNSEGSSGGEEEQVTIAEMGGVFLVFYLCSTLAVLLTLLHRYCCSTAKRRWPKVCDAGADADADADAKADADADAKVEGGIEMGAEKERCGKGDGCASASVSRALQSQAATLQAQAATLALLVREMQARNVGGAASTAAHTAAPAVAAAVNGSAAMMGGGAGGAGGGPDLVHSLK